MPNFWGWLTGRSGGSGSDYPIGEDGRGASHSEDGSYQSLNSTCPKEGFPIIIYRFEGLGAYCNVRGSLGNKCKGCPYNP